MKEGSCYGNWLAAENMHTVVKPVTKLPTHYGNCQLHVNSLIVLAAVLLYLQHRIRGLNLRTRQNFVSSDGCKLTKTYRLRKKITLNTQTTALVTLTFEV